MSVVLARERRSIVVVEVVGVVAEGVALDEGGGGGEGDGMIGAAYRRTLLSRVAHKSKAPLLASTTLCECERCLAPIIWWERLYGISQKGWDRRS